jgi:hypothetical protein
MLLSSKEYRLKLLTQIKPTRVRNFEVNYLRIIFLQIEPYSPKLSMQSTTCDWPLVKSSTLYSMNARYIGEHIGICRY